MLESLRKLLGGNATEDGNSARAGGAGTGGSGGSGATTARTNDVRLAACVLLVELALVDGEFSAVERERILVILQRHFGVDAAGAEALIAEASLASRSAVDDFVFTRQVVRDYDLAQRMVLAELMWQVVLADGTVAGDESYLMRKLAGLLDLEPAYLAEARKRTENTE